MFDISQISMVLFDFDDTLCIHSIRGSWTNQDTKRYVTNAIKNNASDYDYSIPNTQMRLFIQYCIDHNIEMGLLSHVQTIPEARRKINWVKDAYNVSLTDYSVGSRENKIPMLRCIADAKNIFHSEILLVDDMVLTLDEAADADFQTATPMEIVNFVNNQR